MTKSEIALTLKELNIQLIPKSEFWLFRLIGFFVPSFKRYWTTFCAFGVNVIGYPDHLTERQAWDRTLTVEHELVHVKQNKSDFLGVWFEIKYLLLPLPVLFAWYRWKSEREAYLVQIRAGRFGVEDITQTLWNNYAWTWPKPLMRKWFKENAY